jgi:hypothetical protein
VSEQVHSALDAIRFAPTDTDAQAYLDEAIEQVVASERERAVRAEQRVRGMSAELVVARAALGLLLRAATASLKGESADLQDAMATTVAVLTPTIPEARGAAQLAAALDAWCAWLEHNTMLKDGKVLVLATPQEKALYRAWRGQGDGSAH